MIRTLIAATTLISVVALTGVSWGQQKTKDLTDAEAKRVLWLRQIIARIDREKVDPWSACTLHVHGDIKLEFGVDRAGQLVSSRIVESAHSTVLDEAAMAMLRRATTRPLPSPPSEISGDTIYFQLPVRFE